MNNYKHINQSQRVYITKCNHRAYMQTAEMRQHFVPDNKQAFHPSTFVMPLNKKKYLETAVHFQ